MCKVLTNYNTPYHKMPRGFSFPSYKNYFSQFEGNVVECFRIILENRNADTYKKMKQNLDFKGLFLAMEQIVIDYMASKRIKV